MLSISRIELGQPSKGNEVGSVLTGRIIAQGVFHAQARNGMSGEIALGP